MFALRKRFAFSLVTVLLLAVCCGLGIAFFSMRASIGQSVFNYVYQSLKPGMSREEVFAVFGQVGTYNVYSVQSANCGNESLKLEGEDIIVKTRWLFPDYVGALVCFDETGKLVRYQMLIN